MTFALLLLCFFLSGFSALLYETAWTREFAFVFGTSELAVVAVLAAYMGGLAAGAAVAARIAPRTRRPVLAYALLELGIAAWALAVPIAIRAVRALYLGWLGGLEAVPETLGALTHAFHLLGAFAVLMPCTALMGATLPLLARHAVTRDEQVGPRVGLLYAVNTFGAIAGTLAAAFLLLPALGLRQTVYVGAAVNGLVFAAAAALARRAGAPRPEAPRRAPRHWILPLIAVSGAVSFGYEVLWFRLLGNVVGASAAAFSTMLASFLAGIALGSAAASRLARTRAAAARGFAVAQLAIALAAWLGYLAADRLPALADALGASVNRLGPAALVSMAMLLPLTVSVGATFPFAVRLLARDAEEASAASARVYAWNTLGSIVGAVATGYWLLPALGLSGTVVAGVVGNLALAAIASVAVRPRRWRLAAVAFAGVLLLAVHPPPRPDELLRRSPIGGSFAGPFTYFGVGRSATVALIDMGNGWRLTTNGLPESMITHSDYPTGYSAARWLSLLPVLLRPETEEMLVIGFGGGLTVAAVPESVRAVEVIELEPEVLAANRAVPERRGDDPLADPRVSLRLGDARGMLTLIDRRYGAIVSQPSHPWTSGASHLYTREFFALARSRLAPGGVFVQWIGGAFVDPPRLRSLIGSLTDVFEHVHVYRPAGDAIVMVGSDAPLDPLASVPDALARAPEALAVEGIFRVEDVLAVWVLDSDGSRALAEGAPRVTDDFNLLATSLRPSPGTPGRWLNRLLAAYDPLPRSAPAVDIPVLVRRQRLLGAADRARRLVATLEPAEAALARGWIALQADRPASAREKFLEALALEPGLERAATGLALVDGDADTSRLPAPMRAVVEARRARPLDWEAVRARDGELALWRPGELLYPEAAELRVAWRLELGGDDEIAEARRLLTPLLRIARMPNPLLLGARVAARQGDPALAWAMLDALGQVLANQPSRAVARNALRLSRRLGAPPDPEIVLRLRRAVRA